MNNNQKPPIGLVESPNSIRLRIAESMRKDAEKFESFMRLEKLTYAELRLKTTNDDNGTYMYSYFRSNLEEVGIQVEHVSAYVLTPVPDGNGGVRMYENGLPMLLREICFFVKYSPKLVV